ncbi:DUF480 domain-containing protein [Nakamurella aerolata]|uniref:DUF480 domain-containing protein n=1 Tax=Nakamurella aerolata TaxID=1656892 RepID=A0A849ABF5_9ACTN|nr:DUF480 domain-containing protein [Nakamurella aerolata]NNG35810.1 DUF480 domain-containing protein [Nakamurella aerolata]
MPSPTGSLPVLSPIDQRVLGSLLEKQVTVPASYPLSLNALRTACNQTSSREPVTGYAEAELVDALKDLKGRELVRTVWTGQGSRVIRYHQRLEEQLGLEPAERALITVLLLRGAQTAAELRTRTERLHPFADKQAVETALAALADAEQPLVRRLPPQRGHHRELRWIHLLGPVPGADGSADPDAGADAAGAADTELAVTPEDRDAAVLAGYNAVADAYADTFADELSGKDFDRWLLTRVATAAGADPVADVGTGPGQVAAWLAEAGADVTGFDLSPEMIAVARQRFPAARFEVGDLTRLLRPATASGWGAITAWYALVHLAGSELPGAIGALRRVLRPGGTLAVAVHVGGTVVHREEFLGRPVDLDVVMHQQTAVLAAFADAGLEQLEWYRRGPLPAERSSGVDTERLYVLGRAPS